MLIDNQLHRVTFKLLLGHLGLMQVTSNKIGTFVDVSGIDHLDYVVNTLNAGCAIKSFPSDIKAIQDQ
jgi:hypothetical protein